MNPEPLPKMLAQWQEVLCHQEETLAKQEATLQMVMEALTASKINLENTRHSTPAAQSKAKDPDVFYGDSDKVRPFINQLQLKFFHEPANFPDLPSKVSFAGSLL